VGGCGVIAGGIRKLFPQEIGAESVMGGCEIEAFTNAQKGLALLFVSSVNELENNHVNSLRKGVQISFI
jgi:hypothetical protein